MSNFQSATYYNLAKGMALYMLNSHKFSDFHERTPTQAPWTTIFFRALIRYGYSDFSMILSYFDSFPLHGSAWASRIYRVMKLSGLQAKIAKIT